jgi:hypothetical protein
MLVNKQSMQCRSTCIREECRPTRYDVHNGKIAECMRVCKACVPVHWDVVMCMFILPSVAMSLGVSSCACLHRIVQRFRLGCDHVYVYCIVQRFRLGCHHVHVHIASCSDFALGASMCMSIALCSDLACGV